jgi:uncharacterized membrane protein
MAWLAEIRALHILMAAAWFGAAAFLTLYLMPAIGQLGPQGAPVMVALARRRFHVFMAATALLTVASGVWIYWAMTGGFAPDALASRYGQVYGVGGLAGLLAAVIGGAVVGRSSKQLAAMAQAGGAPDPARVAILQARTRVGSRVALGLMLFALLAMTLGHVA